MKTFWSIEGCSGHSMVRNCEWQSHATQRMEFIERHKDAFMNRKWPFCHTAADLRLSAQGKTETIIGIDHLCIPLVLFINNNHAKSISSCCGSHMAGPSFTFYSSALAASIIGHHITEHTRSFGSLNSPIIRLVSAKLGDVPCWNLWFHDPIALIRANIMMLGSNCSSLQEYDSGQLNRRDPIDLDFVAEVERMALI